MKQTFLSFILALLPIMASADDSGTCGDNLTWSYIAATKTLSISGTGAMSYNYISCPWYSYRNNIQNVIIEYGVTYISASAFYGCSGLTSVTIPNSVTSIGDYAFKDCKSLASITIPNSVASIGRSAFDGTGWYNNQPDGLIYIGMVAYKYKGTMPNNTSIQIKDGTIGIAGYAFDGCSGLTSISIPNSVTSIGICAFSNTGWYNNQPNGLIYIGKVAYKYKGTMPNNTFIQIKDGTIGIAGGAFSSCSGMKSVTIPNSVTSIEYQAFYNCSSLTSITIPYNVASIGNGTFDGCSGLTSMKVESGNGVYDSRDNCNAIIETGSNTVIAGFKIQ